MISKIVFTTIGASPMDGSSIMISVGAAIRARPMASICRSPPLRVRATWSLRCPRTGNHSNTRLRLAPELRRLWCAPSSRLSSTLIAANTPRPSGTREMPPRTTRSAAMPAIERPRKAMRARDAAG